MTRQPGTGRSYLRKAGCERTWGSRPWASVSILVRGSAFFDTPLSHAAIAPFVGLVCHPKNVLERRLESQLVAGLVAPFDKT